MGKHRRQPEHNWMPWDDGILRAMHEAGEPARATAQVLGRTPAAIRKRAQRLGIRSIYHKRARGTRALHGTASRYHYGCRCVPCTIANREKVRIRARRYRKERGLPESSGLDTGEPESSLFEPTADQLPDEQLPGTAIVHAGDGCTSCGAETIDITIDEPALIRHAGYGATKRTVFRCCTAPGCPTIRILQVSETAEHARRSVSA